MQLPGQLTDVRYPSRSWIITYMRVVGGIIGVAATITIPLVLVINPRLIDEMRLTDQTGLIAEKQDNVVSPLAEEYSTNLSHSPYSASQYIYLSQSYFSDGQTLSQNRQQSQDDKREILAKLQKALDTISEGITRYPKRSELWVHRAAIKHALAGLSPTAIPSAIADMEQAVSLSPANPDYTKTLSDLYLAQCKQDANSCRLDQAVTYLARTQATKPNDAQLLYSLARLQVKAGLLKNAVTSFAKLLPLITDTKQKQKILAEKAGAEALLAKAGTNSSTPGVEDFNTPGMSIDANAPPAGLELVPDQQTMSRELVVAASEDGASPYEDMVGSRALSGTATIPAGEQSVMIEATRITDTTPVYVTPQGNTNATLSVTSKKAGSHFVVMLDSPQATDTPFSWWVLLSSNNE